MGKAEKVTELPTGKYDAVRTLRHALQQAERGDIKQVVIIANDFIENESDGMDIWACWSDMKKRDVLWMNRWFNSWLNKRYFGDYHSDDD